MINGRRILHRRLCARINMYICVYVRARVRERESICWHMYVCVRESKSPVSNLFLVSYTKSSAVRSSAVSSGCQKSIITTYLSSSDLLSKLCVGVQRRQGRIMR